MGWLGCVVCCIAHAGVKLPRALNYNVSWKKRDTHKVEMRKKRAFYYYFKPQNKNNKPAIFLSPSLGQKSNGIPAFLLSSILSAICLLNVCTLLKSKNQFPARRFQSLCVRLCCSFLLLSFLPRRSECVVSRSRTDHTKPIISSLNVLFERKLQEQKTRFSVKIIFTDCS